MEQIKVGQTKLFMSNRSQAVRLPKAVAFPETVERVEIMVEGYKRVIVPADKLWDSWFDGPAASDDFMAVRGQPEEQEREEF